MSDVQIVMDPRKISTFPTVDKVCIVCATEPEESVDDDLHDKYHIYIVDLAADAVEEDVKNKSPALKFGYEFPSEAMCTLGSKLFMVGGFLPGKSKSIYSYDLNMNNYSDGNTLTLHPCNLHQLDNNMHQPKSSPMLIPTPDNKKILVFSLEILGFPYYQNEDDAPKMWDFEMLDPDTESWTKVASISVPDRWGDDFVIRNYTFVNENIFLFQADDTGKLYTLDIRLSEQTCKLYHDPDFVFSAFGTYMPYYSRQLNSLLDSIHLQFPDLSTSSGKLKTRRLITLLHHDTNECRFCVVHTVMNCEELIPYMMVNVFKLDLLAAGKPLETISSFRFRLHLQLTPLKFDPLFLLPIEL